MNKNVILAIDQGSSGTRAFAVDAAGAVLYKRTDIICAEHPREGYAQYDAKQLLESQLLVLNELLDKLEDEEVSAIAVFYRGIVEQANRRAFGPCAQLAGRPRRQRGGRRILPPAGHSQTDGAL